MKKILSLLLVATLLANAQTLKVSSGKIERLENFKSKYIDARKIDVWLPDGYTKKEKYSVLYMHDGQMLYDAASCWNKQAWEIDEVAGKLIAEGKTKKFIVVGIWNNNKKRHPEYFPQKAYKNISIADKEFISNDLIKRGKTDQVFNPISDNYLKFIVNELKPFIDETFSTNKGRKNTFIAGSSMGGLISLYAVCEYPKVFGGAACMSTHWTGIYQNNDNPIPDAILEYLITNIPKPKNHKIYFDHGDQTLDSLYKPSQERVDKVMISKGFTAKNWTTKFFPGENHSEQSWHKRLYIPFEFLFGKQ